MYSLNLHLEVLNVRENIFHIIFIVYNPSPNSKRKKKKKNWTTLSFVHQSNLLQRS